MSGPTCDVPHQNAWYGTHCSTGAIYSLELRGNNLHGTLPTQLGALPNLWALRLESNPLLSGTVPTEIGALQNLKILDLGNNTISGSLPEELLLLTELVFLDTQGNAFSGTLPSLRPWPNVMHLNMADNLISGSLPRFEMLQDLSYMSMHSNRFSGSIPTHVALLTNLRDRLHFHSNRLSGTLPTQLGSLTQLSLPALYHNSIGGHLPTELARLKPVFPALSYNRISGTTPQELMIPSWRGIDARLDVASNIMKDHCEREMCWYNGLERTSSQSYLGRKNRTEAEERRIIEQANIDREIIQRQLTQPIPITWWDNWSRCSNRQNPNGQFRCSVSAYVNRTSYKPYPTVTGDTNLT